jgi:hypothetical protein
MLRDSSAKLFDFVFFLGSTLHEAKRDSLFFVFAKLFDFFTNPRCRLLREFKKVFGDYKNNVVIQQTREAFKVRNLNRICATGFELHL